MKPLTLDPLQKVIWMQAQPFAIDEAAARAEPPASRW